MFNDTTWPEAIVIVGVLIMATILIGGLMATWLDLRKTKMQAAQADDHRQLVHRYEQLAENSMDAQQRIAADVAELRSRAASIEQILRTVE
jgi:hypothetical protein